MYKNLKTFRESLSMTQKDFAKALALAPTTYSGYEQGVRDPHSGFWISVATKFGVSIDYLMGFSNDPRPTSLTLAYSPEEQDHLNRYRDLDEHLLGTFMSLPEIFFPRIPCFSSSCNTKCNTKKGPRFPEGLLSQLYELHIRASGIPTGNPANLRHGNSRVVAGQRSLGDCPHSRQRQLHDIRGSNRLGFGQVPASRSRSRQADGRQLLGLAGRTALARTPFAGAALRRTSLG